MIARQEKITLAAIVVPLTVLEAAAYLVGGVFEWTAARIWLAMGLGFVALASRLIAFEAAEAVRSRSVLALVMVAVVGYAAVWQIGGVDHVQIQHESPIEVDTGLDAWAEPGLNYAGAAYRAYPARQYLIVAAPALLLGRSLLALRIGFALAVVLGALVFWAAMARTWRGLVGGREAAAVLTIAVFTFPYAIKHLHWYEQTTLPLAFTLAATGWLLVTVDRPTIANLLGLVWIGSLLGLSYTPALGSWSLALGALGWLSWRRFSAGRRDLAWRFGIVALAVAAFGALGFLVRDDLIRSNSPAFRPDPVEAVGEVLSILIFGSPNAFIGPILALPILVILVLGLVGKLGLPGMAISLWTVGIVAASTVLAGGGVADPRFEIHRAQVIIPPLLAMLGLSGLGFAERSLRRETVRPALGVLCLLVTGQAVWATWSWYHEFRPTFRELVVSRLLADLDARDFDPSQRVLVELETQDMYLLNLGDILRYFLTDFEIVTSPETIRERSSHAALVVVVSGPPPPAGVFPSSTDAASVQIVRIVEHDRIHEVLLAITPIRPTNRFTAPRDSP